VRPVSIAPPNAHPFGSASNHDIAAHATIQRRVCKRREIPNDGMGLRREGGSEDADAFGAERPVRPVGNTTAWAARPPGAQHGLEPPARWKILVASRPVWRDGVCGGDR
jgi:hypothetical protein